MVILNGPKCLYFMMVLRCIFLFYSKYSLNARVFSFFSFLSPPNHSHLGILICLSLLFYFSCIQGTRELVFLFLTVPSRWPPVWTVFLNLVSNLSCSKVSIRQDLIAPLHMHLPTITFPRSLSHVMK